MSLLEKVYFPLAMEEWTKHWKMIYRKESWEVKRKDTEELLGHI